ncbi:MAG: hypothetical protein ACNI27_16635 [Desulfovibrio sp.]
MLDIKELEKIESFITSGDLEFEFENGDDEKRGALLDCLEKLMDLSDLADETATKLIFKGNMLEMLSGSNTEK